MDQMLIEINEDRDSDLIKVLREWMRKRHQMKIDEEQRQLADTVIELDQLSLKQLIIKLDNLEKGLRELRRIHASKVAANNLAAINHLENISIIDNSAKPAIMRASPDLNLINKPVAKNLIPA